MAIKYNSDAVDDVLGIANDSLSSLNSGLSDSILNDFSSFSELGLFSNQLGEIKSSVNKLVDSDQSFITMLNNHKNDWENIEDSVGTEISNYAGMYYGNSTNKDGNESLALSANSNSINTKVSVSDEKVSSLISKVNSSNVGILLKKIYEYNKDKSIVDLLIEKKRAKELKIALKQVLGDTIIEEANAGEETPTEEETNIQKAILASVNVQNVDINTEEGKETIEKQVLEKVKTDNIDESKWNELKYDSKNVKEVSLLDGKWIVANTKMDLNAYASYIASAGVRQDSDTKKYSDYCLAFAYVHASDLYNGTKGTATMAGNYAHASEFTDYINDSKAAIMNKIYDEIMNGKPVILQVNGNKAGTSRHFVTVVGFKSGITDPSKLTDKDLLIIDSWDGKIERMDTSTSRFLTTGAQCHKEYNGYRLRVLKA